MKHQENMAVYSSLRNEIIQYEMLRKNTTMYMYTVYAAFLAFSFQSSQSKSSYIFLFSFVAIIPFQCHIISINFMESRKSIYIMKFFEDTRHDIHWEQFHTYEPMLKLYFENDKTLWGIISNYDAVILGTISTMLVIVPILSSNTSLVVIFTNSQNVLSIIFAILLFGICLYIAIKSKRYNKERDRNLNIAIEAYKRFCNVRDATTAQN